jgi:SAM-dependent methyltransferase
MDSLANHNPVGRFDGLAELYARHRPSYPAEAIEHIIAATGLGSQSLLVDIGCGTGISSRQFATAGIPVLGIEPNNQMRLEAETAVPLPSGPAPRYQVGTAELTGLADARADVVLAAQSFHWFEPVSALKEFHRILRPGGWVALMWNERDVSDMFTQAYGEVIRSSPQAPVMESARMHAGAVLENSPLFQNYQHRDFTQQQRLDEEGLLGRAFSVSYVPREPGAADELACRLRQLFSRFQQQGNVILAYQTAVYLAQK